MNILIDFAASLDSMARNLDVYPNFLCLLILFIAIYGATFLFAGGLSTVLALLDISARYLHPRKETWLSTHVFEMVLNGIFVVLMTPVFLATLRSTAAGHGFVVWIMALDFAAGAYHGLFVGRTIAEYRRLPQIWDLMDEVLSL